jgi:hypothetical protein
MVNTIPDGDDASYKQPGRIVAVAGHMVAHRPGRSGAVATPSSLRNGSILRDLATPGFLADKRIASIRPVCGQDLRIETAI